MSSGPQGRPASPLVMQQLSNILEAEVSQDFRPRAATISQVGPVPHTIRGLGLTGLPASDSQPLIEEAIQYCVG